MSMDLPECRNWQVSLDQDNILWLYLDRDGEKINSLSRAVLEEFESLLDAAEKNPPRGLAILSGKSTGFVYGADVREFDGFDNAEAVTAEIERVHDMFNRLEALPCPTVAAIEGFCLGGGLEMALACDYRIAKDTSSTKLGFPEVQLGIFPGFGGSVRSVQRIGGLKAMELMLTARQISARAARSAGLVDEVIGRHEELNWAARRAILKKRSSEGPGLMQKATNLTAARTVISAQMRKRTASKARPEHYPAPYRLIGTWEQYGANKSRMMREEARAVGELMVTPTAIGLRRVFRLMENLKAQGKQSDFRARNVHVVGAGVMGGDIAAWCVLRGLDVSLQDREMKYIEPALKRAEKLFRKKLRHPEKVKAALARLQPDVEGNRVSRADVVIEAIFEDAEAKQKLFEELEPKLKKDAVLATNTSAIPLEKLAEVLKKPSRLVGLHFFNPVPKMPLVEVVASEKSSKANVQKAAAFCGQISRFPLPVKSSPGFLVNRVLAPYMMEALKIHLEGIPAEAIDEAAEAFGMPMGPVELADTVGLDVCAMVTRVLEDKSGNGQRDSKDTEAINFIQRYVEQDKLGKKSGEGLYVWKDDKPQKNASLARGQDLEAISERLIKAYTDECQAALRDGIVADEDLLDAGMVFGTGFAPFRGGPMFYLKHRDEQFKVKNPDNAPAQQQTQPASDAGDQNSESETKPETGTTTETRQAKSD